MSTVNTAPASPAIAFHHVSEMETPLGLIHDLFLGLHHIATTAMDGETGSVVMSMALLGMRETNLLTVKRDTLFELTYPGREHFERTGKVVPA